MAAWTKQVFENNHWDLAQNINAAAGGSRLTKPVALPEKIGDPSLIKRVITSIVRENRTPMIRYWATWPLAIRPRVGSLRRQGHAKLMHALVKRFPLFDNFYDPSRQSADDDPWLDPEGAETYPPDDIQSPVRSAISRRGGDALAWQDKGFLFSEAAARQVCR